METLVLIVHVLVAVSMIGLILLQQGKGAEMGASFGAGSSQTVFGAAGATSLLTKITAWLALIFMITSLVLAVYARKDVALQHDVGEVALRLGGGGGRASERWGKSKHNWQRGAFRVKTWAKVESGG